jgi:hypothetical protein
MNLTSIITLSIFFSAIAIVSISIAGTTKGLKSYECKQKYSSGFTFIDKVWKPTTLSNISYILRPLGTSRFEYGLYETEEDEFPSLCLWDDAGKRNILVCKMDGIFYGQIFTFASKSATYTYTDTSAFLNHAGKTPNSVHIEMGSCTVIKDEPKYRVLP